MRSIDLVYRSSDQLRERQARPRFLVSQERVLSVRERDLRPLAHAM
jgi:hypothetical protein